MKLEKRPRSTRSNETRDITGPVIRALNVMTGVRVVRNNNLGPVVPWRNKDARPIQSGLGAGSADLVGIVTCPFMGALTQSGRVYVLETKSARGVARQDQERWLAAVRRLGGFACVVRSVDEAVAAVVRCRRGASQ